MLFTIIFAISAKADDISDDHTVNRIVLRLTDRIDQSLYGMTSPEGLPIASIKKIRDKLWSDRQLIDSYVQRNPNHLSDADLAILMGWKNAIADSFTVLHHLKSGSIFIPMSFTDAAYIVSGIYSPWDEMLRGAPLPQVIDAVLIPFENNTIIK